MPRFLSRLSLVLGAVASVSNAQTPATLDSVDRYVRAELARQRVPGMSIAILRGDSIVLARGYGLANVELNVPASDSTIYQSGSLGKMFTAAAVVMLAEQGKLKLDDPLSKYLSGPPAWKSITIRHLLTHTSGIPDYTDSTVSYRLDYSEDTLVALAAKMTPIFSPGERWSYSNTGYLLLGAVIRKASGRFYGDLLKDEIFTPAGMRTARVISESDIVPNRADGYRLKEGQLKNQEWVSPSLNTTADGALYLTVRDLAQWSIAVNHRRIITWWDTVWSPVKLAGGGTYPYGFGWAITHQRGQRRIGHTGSWQGFKTSLQRYPDAGLTVIAMANLSSAIPEAVTFGIAGILQPSLAPPHLVNAPEPRAATLRPLADVLRDVAGGKSTTRLTPAYERLLDRSAREDLDWALGRVTQWTPAGCDAVRGRGISRLGSPIERICYVRGAGTVRNFLFSILYTADGRVATVERYSF